MASVVVIGSGASGTHFALTALERGHTVAMLDVGYTPPPPVLPEASFDELKERLADPVAYFIGEKCSKVVYPRTRASYYDHPPSKGYVFATPSRFRSRAAAMEPRFSFARGGLAEAWTAGAYRWTEDDLADFPFAYEDFTPFYHTVARRIGLGGAPDDLEPFLPLDDDDLEPLELDGHSRRLLAAYERRRDHLNGRLGFYLGRSRVAALRHDGLGRKGCADLGRCLWGCPTGAIYSPAMTLAACQAHAGFSYLPHRFVRAFEYDPSGRVTSVIADTLPRGEQRVEGDIFVLAGGALCSSKIILDSIYRQTKTVLALGGLMDNRQIHMPFLSPGLIGAPVTTAAYQFHHLAFGLVRERREEYVHGQITTLKAASVHPIVQNLPVDLRTAIRLFRGVRTGLGIANINLHDRRRPESHVTIEPESEGRSVLKVHYHPGSTERVARRQAARDVKRALRQLGCLVPPAMMRVLPMGTSAHYAGTLPMTTEEVEYTTTPDGQVRGFGNLYAVDGATFPFLPAKNLTLTLMANATRIATRIL